MAIPVVCNDCFYQFQAPDKALGREIKCPECGSIVRISKSEDLIPEAPKVRRGPSKKKTRERKSEEKIPSGSGGAVAGIAIGAVLLVAMIVGGVVLLRPDSNEVTSVEPAAPEFQIELNNDVVKVDGRVIRNPALATSVRRYADNGPVQLGYTPEKTLFAVTIIGWTQQDRRPDFDLSDLSKGLAEIRRQKMAHHVIFDELSQEEIFARREKTFGKRRPLEFSDDDDKGLDVSISNNTVTMNGQPVNNPEFSKRVLECAAGIANENALAEHREVRPSDIPKKNPSGFMKTQSGRVSLVLSVKSRDGKVALLVIDFEGHYDSKSSSASYLGLLGQLRGINFSQLGDAMEELRLSNYLAEAIFADGSQPLSITTTPGMEHAKLQKEEFGKNTQKDEEPIIDTTVTTSGFLKFVVFGVVTLTLLGIAWFKFLS